MHSVIRWSRFTSFVIALALVTLPALAATPVADVDLGFTQVTWTPQNDFAGLHLTVSGPEGVFERDFGPNEAPQFELASLGATVDGLYTWELRATPHVDGELKAVAQARAAGNVDDTTRVRPKSLPPLDALVQNGAFRVVDGAIAQPATEAPAPGLKLDLPGNGTGSASAPLERATAAVQVIAQDLVVQGSECVGLDCVSSESFGFDTFRLKENNLRIHFDDTSNSGSFPSNDWRLQANDSQNGGASYFAIQDATAGRNSFIVEAGARTNALVVDSSGKIGVGTAAPAIDLHVIQGNTPALRLQQDGSSGFAQQTWDVAGNEANFFVRDVTNGSLLSFRIIPGAPGNSLYVDADGDVGLGTAAPAAALHVTGSAGDSKVLVTETSGTPAGRVLFEISNNGAARFDITDTSQSRSWRFANGGTNFSIIDLADPGTVEFLLANNGNLTISGELTTMGTTCGGGGCDLVFAPDTEIESIEEHAAMMWENRHLPAVGPTEEGKPFNLTQKTGGMLNELEKAHIYIAQLNGQLTAKDQEIEALHERMRRIEAHLGVE